MKALIKIGTDIDVENPCDDGFWKLSSFSRRHSAYADPEDFGIRPSRQQHSGYEIDNKTIANQLKHEQAFLLSYYAHGNCIWGLQGEVPECPFDSVWIAGILQLQEPKDIPIHRRKEAARQFLKSYTDWCNGDVLYYQIEDAEDGLDVDGCGGYYLHDIDYMLHTIAESLVRYGFTEYQGHNRDCVQTLECYSFDKIFDKYKKDPATQESDASGHTA